MPIIFGLVAVILAVLYLVKPRYDEKLSEDLVGAYCYEGATIELRDTSARFFDQGNLQTVLDFSPNNDNFGWLLNTGKSVQLGVERDDRTGAFTFGEATRMMRIDEQGRLLIPKAGGGAIAFERCDRNPS